MLNETSVAGLRALQFLVAQPDSDPVSPRRIAEALGLSPSYLAKVVGQYTKAAILRSHRGAKGGVSLARDPSEITLREIVEACQGRILGRFCSTVIELDDVCGFHEAMAELHDVTTSVLERWTLADLAARPCPVGDLSCNEDCMMT